MPAPDRLKRLLDSAGDVAPLPVSPEGIGVVDIAGDHLNAERFLTEHGSRVRYSPELGRWFLWNGAWWEEDRLEQVHQAALSTIDGLRAWAGEATTEREFKRRSGHYVASTRSGRRDGMLQLARSAPAVVVAVSALDRHPHLLACRNGLVDLRTGELKPADPSLLITRGVDLDYDPEAVSEEWAAFLSRIFGDSESLVEYVRRLLGYLVTGEVGEHLLPIWHGPGANGKSTLVKVLMTLLGEHAAVAPEGLLIESKHEQHPERLAALRGRRLVVSSELEHRAVLAEGLVKLITGGDTISARQLYGQRFDFEPSHKLVLITNHPPRVRGTDEAIWRRLRMVPFSVTIPADERIPGYAEQLVADHGQAILSWLVKGAVEWYRGGLGTCAEVDRATGAYRASEDVFSQFLAERTVNVETKTRVRDLRNAWTDWAREAGAPVGRVQDFTEWLDSRGFEIVQFERANWVKGIGLTV